MKFKGAEITARDAARHQPRIGALRQFPRKERRTGLHPADAGGKPISRDGAKTGWDSKEIIETPCQRQKMPQETDVSMSPFDGGYAARTHFSMA